MGDLRWWGTRAEDFAEVGLFAEVDGGGYLQEIERKGCGCLWLGTQTGAGTAMLA